MNDYLKRDLARIHDPASHEDDELRFWLGHHERQIAEAQRRYGGSTRRSSASLLQEAYDNAKPYQDEARARGITSSKLYDALMKMSDRTLATLHKCGKVRMPHLFTDPKAMIVLRNVCQRRGLFDE